MGIHELSKVIGDKAPTAVKENEMKNLFGWFGFPHCYRPLNVIASLCLPTPGLTARLFVLAGRKVAIDASMSIYQFLIAVRSEGANLTNEEGETTSHLSGLFYRTIRIMSHGIKPVYAAPTPASPARPTFARHLNRFYST